MLTFIARRMLAAVFILLGSTFIAFVLVVNSGDPLGQAHAIPNPPLREVTVQRITTDLHLDQNIIFRYFLWLKGALGCLTGHCDFGDTINQSPGGVNEILSNAILVSLRLITTSVVLSIIIGITLGIISALRQYSGFDYTVTFIIFFFFALPVFWIGIVLKNIFAIRFNKFLDAGAAMTWGWIFGISIVVAIIAYGVFGVRMSRRLIITGATFVVSFIACYYITVEHWLLNPSLGIVMIAILSVAIALGSTVLTSGLANRRSLYSALTSAGVGVALWYPLQYYFYSNFNFWKLMMLLVIAIAVGIIIGYLWGGPDAGLSARNAALTAFGVSFVIFVDRIMRAWNTYINEPQVKGHPIPTNLPNTPGLQGDFWIQLTDTLVHLAMPTAVLMLISVATHSRFSRASMLEVMNQDYIRTARSKGVTERTVVMRHAFRNALIPMATVVAFDIAGVLGGAVLTEKVFGWVALGQMFQTGLTNSDPNLMMAYFLIGAIVAVLANMLADIAYAALDPRIRL
jgi:peptide/nickel transport system permease protein